MNKQITISLFTIIKAFLFLLISLVALLLLITTSTYLEYWHKYNNKYNITSILIKYSDAEIINFNSLLGMDVVCVRYNEPLEQVISKHFPGKKASRLEDYYNSYLGSDDPRWVILGSKSGSSDVEIMEVWGVTTWMGGGVKRPPIDDTICSNELIVVIAKDDVNARHMEIKSEI